VSTRGVLRGLHYQHPHAQGKLVMALYGEVFDVAVDIRPASPHFGRWYGAILSAENGHQLWIPEGFAHGYAALSDTAVFAYKCTTAYHPEGDAAVAWDELRLIGFAYRQPALDSRCRLGECVAGPYV
jgi:dTDP-4-dehydrorhamnose 3,5-epimerase